MKLLSAAIIVIIVSTNSFYIWASPINLTNVLDENVHVKEKILTLNDLSSNPEFLGGHYQGDMILPDEVLRGAAHRPLSQRWPSGIIPYEITPSIFANHTMMIIDQMRQMENLLQVNDTPCITFRPKTVDDSIFIIIQNGSGCSAYVGYLQNYTLNRTVTLMHTANSTCMVSGIIQHELIHVLGFYHEQSRPDRDDYVSIQWENIVSGTESNFNKYSEEEIDTLMISYDYGSVMHYNAFGFSVNGLPTIIPTRNASAVLGQRVGMSPVDILEVQRYYGCVSTPSSTIIPTSTPSPTIILTSTPSPTTAPTSTPSSTIIPTSTLSPTTSAPSISSTILPNIASVLLFFSVAFLNQLLIGI